MFKNAVTVIAIFTLTVTVLGSDRCTEGLTFNGFTGKLACGEKKLLPKELPVLMKQVPEADSVFTKGKRLITGSVAPLSIGGFGLGWAVGTSFFKGPLSASARPSLIAGAVGLSIGLPTTIIGNTMIKKAVGIYNDQSKSSLITPEIIYSGTTLSLIWNF